MPVEICQYLFFFDSFVIYLPVNLVGLWLDIYRLFRPQNVTAASVGHLFKHLFVDSSTPFFPSIFYLSSTVRFFYRWPDYRSCHGLPRRMQALYAVQLSCLVRRWILFIYSSVHTHTLYSRVASGTLLVFVETNTGVGWGWGRLVPPPRAAESKVAANLIYAEQMLNDGVKCKEIQ